MFSRKIPINTENRRRGTTFEIVLKETALESISQSIFARNIFFFSIYLTKFLNYSFWAI